MTLLAARPLRPERAASWLLFLLLAALVLLVFRDYGISNDEPVQHTYGRLLWNWYESGFSDERAFHYKNLYLYGGLFDLIAAKLADWLPLPAYEARHLLSALFGLAGLLAVWRLGRLLGGEPAALLAVLLLATTGMYGGAMFTHTKDVPFAAAMAWCLYYTTRLTTGLPGLPPWRLAAKLGLALGCAAGLRVGAAFAVLTLMLALPLGVAMVRTGWRARAALLASTLLRLLPGAAIALAVTAATWPWVVREPQNLLEAARTFSHFAFRLETLVGGETLPIDQVPATYLSEYLLVKLPELMLLGLLAAVLLLPRRGRWPALLPLCLAIAVPLAFTLLTRPPLYNGIRHFLFLLPPLTVAASLGLQALWRRLERPSWRLAATTMLVGLFLANAVTFARLHPYEYVGYNQLVGGLSGAAGRYEGDYWAASLREASLQLRRRVEAEGPPDVPYRVAVCAEGVQAATWLGPWFQTTSDWTRADFFVTALHVGCDAAMPGEPLLTVERLGVPLALVKDLRALPPGDRRPVERHASAGTKPPAVPHAGSRP